MQIKQTFDVIVKDINGTELFVFKNVKPVIKAETITISSERFVKNQHIVLECVAENALAGEVTPDEMISESR